VATYGALENQAARPGNCLDIDESTGLLDLIAVRNAARHQLPVKPYVVDAICRFSTIRNTHRVSVDRHFQPGYIFYIKVETFPITHSLPL
jgi:hypothetical protein